MTSLFLLSVLFTQGSTGSPATPDATIQAYRAAIAKSDVEAFANLTQGPAGATLRKLAPPLKKAQAASEALSKALSEKPALGVSNPFANSLNPLTGYLLEVIELTPGKEQHLVRVRFGTAGKLQEETLSIKKEADAFRVSLPSVYLKSVTGITPEQLTKQTETLGKLATSLTSIAEQVSKGELSTKEAVLLKLAQVAKDLDTNPKR